MHYTVEFSTLARTCYIDNDFLQGQIGDFPFQKPCDAFFCVSEIFFFSLNERLPDAEKFLAQICNSFDSIIAVKCRLLKSDCVSELREFCLI